MKTFLTILLFFVCAPAWPDSDPVQACRDAHEGDAEAHIACLETALMKAIEAEPSHAATAAADDSPAQLGAEQLRGVPTPEEAAIDSMQVRIVATRYNVEGMGTFLMEDGQVWRETMAAPKRWRLEPDQQYEAHIKRAMMGGYRLHVDGIRGMMSVRRIQ